MKSPVTSCKRFLSRFSMPLLRLTSFDRGMGSLLLALISLDMMLARLVKLRTPDHPFTLLPWQMIGIMIATLLFTRWREMPRAIDAAGSLLWGSLFVSPLSFLVQLAGRSPFRLVDRQLAWIDGHMHFSTAYIHMSIDRFPFYATCSILAYVLFVPVMLSAMTIPSLCGHVSASRQFVLGVVIAMLIGAAIFVFFPAAGPWMSEAMRPTNIQSNITDYLVSLKSGIPMQAEMNRAAIVSFPSEHVVVAVLGAQALRVIKFLRIPTLVIALLICVSTVTTGWHYGIDVVGGLLVAYVSSALAKRICAVWEARDLKDIQAASAKGNILVPEMV